MNIDLHIEQLILHHCAPNDRERVGAAVRQELERLIAERGLSPSLLKGTDIARLNGGRFQIRPDAPADHLGRQIAAAAYEGIRND